MPTTSPLHGATVGYCELRHNGVEEPCLSPGWFFARGRRGPAVTLRTLPTKRNPSTPPFDQVRLQFRPGCVALLARLSGCA